MLKVNLTVNDNNLLRAAKGMIHRLLSVDLNTTPCRDWAFPYPLFKTIWRH